MSAYYVQKSLGIALGIFAFPNKVKIIVFMVGIFTVLYKIMSWHILAVLKWGQIALKRRSFENSYPSSCLQVVLLYSLRNLEILKSPYSQFPECSIVCRPMNSPSSGHLLDT